MHLNNIKYLILAPVVHSLVLSCASAPSVSGRELASGGFKTYALSLANDPLTLHSVNMEDVKSQRKKLLESNKNDSETLASLVGMGRWQRENLDTMKKQVGQFVELESSKDSDVSEYAKFDLAIAAYYAHSWGEMFLWLEELQASKDKVIAAQVANFRGVLAINDGRIPEAGEFFKLALSLDPKNEGALLNMGFLNLKYGYYEESEKQLTLLTEDTLAASGLIISTRMLNRDTETATYCQTVLQKTPKYKPALFNCALSELQDRKDIKRVERAQDLLEKCVKLPGGDAASNKEASKLLGEVNKILISLKSQK